VGLVVIALVLLTAAAAHRTWRRAVGRPLPRVTARDRHLGPVRGFLDRLGKVAAPARPAPAPVCLDLDARRRALDAVRAGGADAGPAPDCDVLVVGAGPSGLMTASLLIRQGVRVRIVDAGAGPAGESRAFAVQARTVELFASIGLADRLVRRGVVTTGIRFHIAGKAVGGLDFDRSRADDTPYPYILMAPQSEVEELLLQDLARHGVSVERGTRLVTLTQDEHGVTAALDRTGHSRPGRLLTARYLIGADGAHSSVRKGLGLDFGGDPYTQRYLLADCRVDWPLDHTQFRVFMNGERIGLFLPLRGTSLSRVMTTDLAEHDRTEQDGVSLERLQEDLRSAMGLPISLSEPVWTSRYQAHLRQVERYRVGRAFLVGDAAHIHSPAGGQGMNTGLLDAANLAWKLAAVLRTGADPALLDTYHDERHPVGAALLRFTDRLYRVAAGLRGWRARLRDTVGPFLLRRMSAAPIPHRKSFRRLSQIGLAYPPGPYIVNELLYSLKGPHAGDRAPDARVNTDHRVFDLLQGYRLHVLALSRRRLTDDEVAGHRARLADIAGYGGHLATHLVGRVAGRPDDRVEHVDSVEVFDRYGLTDQDSQALYVVRPDGHVAWRCDELDYDACRRFLARLHGGIAACEASRRASAA
jgi:2-polyprenyl-6-methoxyphenol hydroxylase-like FAD-dependent oxidoreductase